MKLSNYVNQYYIKLSSDEIIKLFDDRESNKEIIIKSQLPQILKIAKSFQLSTGNNIEELFSEALLIITECINTFDLTRGFTFYSYYKQAIKNRLLYFNDNGIRIPLNQLIDNPSTLTTTTPFSHLETDERTFDNTLKHSTNYDINEDDYEHHYNPTKQIKIIQDNTKPKQADIIIKYIGLTGDAMNFKEIAEVYNESIENIRLHYNNGIKRLQLKHQP